jgi:hypothetical protein
MRAVADDLHLGREPLDTAIQRGRRAKRVKAPKASEAQIETMMEHALRLSGYRFVKNPNEAASRALGRATRIHGTRKGWPDRSLYGRNPHHALVEVKIPGWKPRNEREREHWARQQAVHAELRAMGWLVWVVHSLDELRQHMRDAGWPERA